MKVDNWGKVELKKKKGERRVVDHKKNAWGRKQKSQPRDHGKNKM